ncbi:MULTISPECIES: Gfo/Idh/MocA family oxidoreductase [Halomonadaceae]|uniref:Gfo/Idh/MocA family oxidoreductase n=2 Tax=Vreelandella TaxID=3137766 RepID=A0A7Z0LRR7_9GAMM|nr:MULTISPECIES: Gfo/Idh/MocA family oxidoreductase [Halomonas]NYS77351.1 Gfo/Idh/MocA family oxidoreductase [Halomonas glaciei]|tara:strand:- start:2413 stop:3480 length:1068 start_codon:yes stop_codon:yes gene_type:complete
MSHCDLPIRTAIVGFGVAGSVFHAPLIDANESYCLECIVTGNTERAKKGQEHYPQTEIIRDFASLLAALDSGRLVLDLVILATPPEGHCRQAKALIERGLALVIDKPLATNREEGEDIIQAARTAGTPITVFQNRRLDADFITLARLIKNNDLGVVHSFESRFTWWMPEGFGNWRDTTPISQAGGLLYDLGSHLIDQAIQLFGPVDTVEHAELDRHSSNPGGDEDTFVSLIHRSGVRTRLWMNGLAAQGGPRFHVLGSRGAFVKYGLDAQEAALSRGESPLGEGYGVDDSIAFVGAGEDIQQVSLLPGNYPGYYCQLAHALTSSGALPVAAEEALYVLAIIEDIHRRFPLRHPTQ